jgi:hypothetical protein
MGKLVTNLPCAAYWQAGEQIKVNASSR